MKTSLNMLALAAVLGCVACQNTVNTVENSDKSYTRNVVNDRRVVTDGALRDRLAVTDVATSTAKSGLLRVQVSVTNMRTGFFSEAWSGMTGENPYRVNYRFRWFDEDGMAVNSPNSVWKTAIIQPGETKFLTSVAPNADCADFMLDLEEAD